MPIAATPTRRIKPPAEAQVLPRTGTALLGSARACRAAAALTAALEHGSPILAGWIALDDSDTLDPWSLPRLGTLDDLPVLAARLNLRCLVVCAPAADHPRIRRAARALPLDLRFVPSPEELLGRAGPAAAPPEDAPAPRAPMPADPASSYRAPPAIDLASLIGRTPHALDRDAVARILAGKRILITGAGGSIGSELARLAASFGPERLILMERAENALFEIDRQIAARHPGLPRRAVLHDVADAEGTMRLVADLRPHAVFHAAAHKHVPLMEDHPAHAITNNLFGTKSIADAALAAGAERFVLISSDKAVNPTSIMGATKRLAELYIRSLGPRAGNATRLSMVRFGNVLGSACSVLTIWSSQIAEALASGSPGELGEAIGGGGGGPDGSATAAGLTITDPRMTRYFMTIPEAATLVMQSTTLGRPGAVGVFVLDMGQPIRIVDLACRFIRAHGLHPRLRAGLAAPPGLAALVPEPPPGSPTVDLVFTGARPGEKLHEELAYAAESLRPTDHPGIRTWAGPGFSDADVARAQDMVADLSAARFHTDRAAILAAIRRYIPEMRAAAI